MGIAAILAAIWPTAIATTGGVTMLMAFMVFGKRRRDGEPTADDDVLADRAARGTGLAPAPKMMPSTVMPGAAVAASAVQAAAPRPRRDGPDRGPSAALAPAIADGARKTDPLRTVSTNIRLTFDGETETAVTGMERRLIRYRLVSLLNQPDEVRGVEIGVLDEGDEVVLLEKRGTYWRVLCPGRARGLAAQDDPRRRRDRLVRGRRGDVDVAADNGPTVGGFEDVLRGLHRAPPAVRRELAGRRIGRRLPRSPRSRGLRRRLPQHDDVLVHDVGHERVRVAVGP